MKEVAYLVELTVCFTWDEDDAHKWHFGSVERAREWVEAKKDVKWYAIEAQRFIPCSGEDERGQLYIGVDYMDFVEVA